MEDLISTLLQHLPTGVLVVEIPQTDDLAEAQITRANPEVSRFTGGTISLILNHPLRETGISLDSPAVQAVLKAHQTGETQFLPEFNFSSPRVNLWLSLKIVPVNADTVVIYAEDTTRWHRTEAELDVVSARYRAFVEASPDMLHLVDAEGRFLDTHAGKIQTAYDPAEYLGRTVYEVFPENIASGIMERIRWTLEYQKVAVWQYTLPQLQGMTFEARFVEVHVAPSGPGEVMIIVRDITELRQAHDRLEALVETRTNQLHQTNEALQQFVYAASHDLREPLNKITAFGQRLGEKYQHCLDDRGRQYLTVMQTAAQRMTRLIDDLLEFSRVGRDEAPSRIVVLNRVLEEVQEDLELAIQNAEAVVEVGDLPEVQAHSLRMRQVFQNLVSNAIKFRRPGVLPKVQVTGRVERGWAIIEVRDNGIGFDPQYAETIFTLFKRLHTRFEYPGTGIGLALCRRILDQYGGTIHAESTPGEGSILTVRLPALGGVH